MDTQTEEALSFLWSQRGRYIVAQALHEAIKVMSAVQPEAWQEKSNIDDMRYLRRCLFNMPDILFSHHDERRALHLAD